METPKITLSEALTVGGTAVTILPHDPVVAIALLPIGAGIWGLRRFSGFRSWVAAQREKLEEQDFVGRELACYALERLPVPPVGVKGLLVNSQAEERQRVAEPTSREPRKASPSVTSRLPETMFALFGDDDPRKRVPKRDLQPKAERPRREACQFPAPEPGQEDDDAWLNRYAGVEQPKAKPQQAHKASLKVIPIKEVCRLLNEEVDDRPHVLIVGNSGAGKTVLAQLLIGTRPGKVVILDPKRPKGWEGPKWGGLPYVSRDKETASYRPMVEALKAVVKEMDHRYRTQDEASEPFEQLTIVLDEAKNSVEECQELAEQYRKIVSIGREVGIRLILISTTDRAGKLGFSGEADSMDSLAWVRLGNFARDVLGEEVADRLGDRRYHWAAIGLGAWTPFENGRSLELVQKLNLGRNKAWQKVTYNCQASQRTTQAIVTPPPMEPVLASGAVDGVEEAEVRVTKPIQVPDNLLAKLLEIAPETVVKHAEVSMISADEVTGEVVRSNGHFDKSQIGTSSTSDAKIGTSEVSNEPLKGAVSVWRNTPPEVREVIGKALQLHLNEGKSKTAAIREVTGVTGGDKFKPLSEAFDAALALKKAVRKA